MAEVLVYTIAGGLSSAFVGILLGRLGQLLLPGPIGPFEIIFAISVAGITIARELRLVSFPLPQLRRQTKDFWAKVFPGTVAAALWGLDLGLIFSTWLTFSGVWLLVVIALLVGDPTFGAVLFIFYWLGRALSVWIAPLLMPDADATSNLMNRIHDHFRLFQRIHAVGLAWAVFVLLYWLVRVFPILE